MEKFKELLKGKFITDDIFDRAVARAREQLEEAMPAELTSGIGRGAAAGTGVLARTAQGPGGESMLEKLQRKGNELLQDIKDNQAEFAAQPVLIRWS